MDASDGQSVLELTAVVWQEGDDFVSLCPELGVTSCGSDLEEAVAMLQEAVDLYLENARALDMLDDTVASLTSARRWTTSIRVAV
jgi:predicted RNase H-like HicB family nuclease